MKGLWDTALQLVGDGKRFGFLDRPLLETRKPLVRKCQKIIIIRMEFTGSKGDSSISAVDFKVLQLFIYTKKAPNLNCQIITRKSADRFFGRKYIPW